MGWTGVAAAQPRGEAPPSALPGHGAMVCEDLPAHSEDRGGGGGGESHRII